MNPPESKMTPEPEPGGAPCCDPPEGTPRVRMVTTEGRTFVTMAGTVSSVCGASRTSAAAGAWDKLVMLDSQHTRRRAAPHRLDEEWAAGRLIEADPIGNGPP